jgi:hypothetical protein
MGELVWLPFAVKIAATVGVVVAAALVAERAGPFVGALVACLPVSAGPAYVLLAMQADDAFIGASALASAATIAATGVFLLVYVFLAERAGLVGSLLGGYAAWFAVALAVESVGPRAATVVLLNLAVYGPGVLLTRIDGGAKRARAARSWFDLPLQAALIGALTAVVLVLGKVAGPTATGLAAVFPVVFTSVALILHPRLGGAATAATMAGALRAMPGFALGLLVLHATAVPLGRVAGLLLALVTTLLWSGALLLRHLGTAAAPQRHAADNQNWK